jgi:aminopeptidase
MPNPISKKNLKKLAKLSIHTGLGLEKGQDLIISAPIEALPLVRLVTKEAYKAGAGLVSCFFGDDQMSLLRYEYAQDESFDKAPTWLFEGMAKAFDENAARLAIIGDNPMLLAKADPKKVGRVNKAMSKAGSPVRERITAFNVNWNIIAYPTRDWAKLVFPKDSSKKATKKLADAIFAASRADKKDPIAEWKKHNATLAIKSKWLNEQNFGFLHFKGEGTDLVVGLADGHEWAGGAAKAKNGITCNANIPSEEVFTTPHANKVDGYVRSTKPLSHAGTLIDDIKVTFKDGKIIKASASKGEEVLLKLLDTDEGARRLGEVALVPHSSPISASGILFYNTLFDENASCHIALGQCYSKCFVDGDKITKEQVKEQGGNTSAIHVDWMIGSDKMDIDGITQSGEKVPVFRQGEWA